MADATWPPPAETACSHCGRYSCKEYGDEDCQAARKRFFEDMQKRIDRMFGKRDGDKGE